MGGSVQQCLMFVGVIHKPTNNIHQNLGIIPKFPLWVVWGLLFFCQGYWDCCWVMIKIISTSPISSPWSISSTLIHQRILQKKSGSIDGDERPELDGAANARIKGNDWEQMHLSASGPKFSFWCRLYGWHNSNQTGVMQNLLEACFLQWETRFLIDREQLLPGDW